MEDSWSRTYFAFGQLLGRRHRHGCVGGFDFGKSWAGSTGEVQKVRDGPPRQATTRANRGRLNLEASSTARSSPPTPRSVSPLSTPIEAPYAPKAEPNNHARLHCASGRPRGEACLPQCPPAPTASSNSFSTHCAVPFYFAASPIC